MELPTGWKCDSWLTVAAQLPEGGEWMFVSILKVWNILKYSFKMFHNKFTLKVP